MSRRSQARETALQMLYQIDLNPDADPRAIREMINERLSDADTADFAWSLFRGVQEFRTLIDEKIQAVAMNWKLFRMAATDRNVLRLGTYELIQTDTPHRIVIDEAVELAKKFGNANSSQFVNGILDKLVPPEKRA